MVRQKGKVNAMQGKYMRMFGKIRRGVAKTAVVYGDGHIEYYRNGIKSGTENHKIMPWHITFSPRKECVQ